MNTGNCSTSGRQEPNGLTLFSRYNFIISWDWRSLSCLYFAWISFICGASACIRTIDLIWRNVSGTSTARTQIVSNTIEKPQLIPTWLWKNTNTD